MGGGLSPQEKRGAIAGKGKRRRGRQPLLVFLCTHAYGQRAGHLTHRLWAKEYLLHGLKMAGHFSLGIQLVQITDSRGKSQQPSHTPELGMEFVKSVNRHHLSSICLGGQYRREHCNKAPPRCSQFPGKTQALLLTLLNILGSNYTCLRVTAQGPATRRSLHCH